MAEVRRLLVATDLSVEEVGRRVGYGDPNYFMRRFRRAARSRWGGAAPAAREAGGRLRVQGSPVGSVCPRQQLPRHRAL